MERLEKSGREEGDAKSWREKVVEDRTQRTPRSNGLNAKMSRNNDVLKFDSSTLLPAPSRSEFYLSSLETL